MQVCLQPLCSTRAVMSKKRCMYIDWRGNRKSWKFKFIIYKHSVNTWLTRYAFNKVRRISPLHPPHISHHRNTPQTNLPQCVPFLWCNVKLIIYNHCLFTQSVQWNVHIVRLWSIGGHLQFTRLLPTRRSTSFLPRLRNNHVFLIISRFFRSLQLQ